MTERNIIDLSIFKFRRLQNNPYLCGTLNVPSTVPFNSTNWYDQSSWCPVGFLMTLSYAYSDISGTGMCHDRNSSIYCGGTPCGSNASACMPPRRPPPPHPLPPLYQQAGRAKPLLLPLPLLFFLLLSLIASFIPHCRQPPPTPSMPPPLSLHL